MKTLSKVRFSRDFFQNEISNGNSSFRINKFNRKVKIAKRDCDFSMGKKEAIECQTRLENFRKKSLYGENFYQFKSKKQEENFILNNFSIAHKKQAQKVLSSIAFEKRKKARNDKLKKQVFGKIFG